MKNYANLASPMTPSYRKADRSKMTSEGVDTTEYQSLTGRLNWLALKTRPEGGPFQDNQSTFRL
ncbi:hypothetical protein BO71DRAFT_431567 [Aspergillus ellipticus CBS 707.79]|uniref:Uncharacterized protein n=1 Tax=Aspergillus ellipticus CBS 707.79 TaxID=1448320 RepID=A0A319D601_9EURO|nr:hypothetical protein BO71DRAFT_431567 [Aspergillus ellipticus CBS 707.79]